MIDQIDKRITALENEIEELKRRKIAYLQAQVAEIQASLLSTGDPAGKSGQKSSGRAARAARSGAASSPGGWVADLLIQKGSGAGKGANAPPELSPARSLTPSVSGKRGRRPGKRVPDEKIIPSLTKLVCAAGKEGISARKVARVTGVFYKRVVALMDKHFRKTGDRKWSRYHVK